MHHLHSLKPGLSEAAATTERSRLSQRCRGRERARLAFVATIAPVMRRSAAVLALLVAVALSNRAGAQPPAASTPASAAPDAVKATKKSAAKPAKASGKAKRGNVSTPTATAKPPAPSREALLNPPSKPSAAPEKFDVKLETTKGDIILEVTRAWAPKGADRIYELVKLGYYNDVAFFRVIQGFMAQVGLHGDPEINTAWRAKRIDDDPVKQSNTRGMVSFATAGPKTRTTQFFINFADNSRLDGMGFAPFAKVRDMKLVDALFSGYGEGAPQGQGPSQGRIQSEGNAYLKSAFPKLDYIKTATIVESP